MIGAVNVAQNLRDIIQTTLDEQQGVIFTKSALVYRDRYNGRGILGKNSSFDATDEHGRKGYVPVELWVMSFVHAENPVSVGREGFTESRLCDGSAIGLDRAVEVAGDVLFGPYAKDWPLTKILDIGGEPKKPKYSDGAEGELEFRPIPPHVHPGITENGKFVPPGKWEAYYYPPYEGINGAVCRIGFQGGVTESMVLDAFGQFGKSDDMYRLLTSYPVSPGDGWIIPGRVIHSSAALPTLEIQFAQDDSAHIATLLEEIIRDEVIRIEVINNRAIKGFKGSPEEFIRQAIDWEASMDCRFRDKYHAPERVLKWDKLQGVRKQLFQSMHYYSLFYGEAYEVNAGQTMVIKDYTNKNEPVGAVVWKGEGLVNGQEVKGVIDRKGVHEECPPAEFLVTPEHEATVTNTGQTTLIVYTVQPIRRGNLILR